MPFPTFPKPQLFIRVTHTGVYADGRPNTSSVLLSDLDVGYEYQWRKVPVYVPFNGYIDIPASSRSMLSFDQGAIFKGVNAGIITAQFFIVPESYTTVNRPSATTFPAGASIWNTTENAPNYSNGVIWISFAGGGPPAPHAPTHLSIGTDPIDPVMGATALADGLDGLVPKPLAGQNNYFLRGDGTWAAPIPSIVEVVGVLYNVTTTDEVVLVNQVPAANVTIQLPPGGTHVFKTVTIKDKKGTASLNPITILPALGETIDGSASWVINGDYIARQLVFYGTEWSIV